MKSIRWTKADLTLADIDFSFCAKWTEVGKKAVWQHEAERELKVHTKRFIECPRKVEAAESAPSDYATAGLESVSFDRLFSQFYCDDTRTERMPKESLLHADKLRVYPTSCLHLFEIDYNVSDTELRKSFAVWLKEQRKKLGIPAPRGRGKNRTLDHGEWLEDLAMYRLRSAGFKPSEAEQKLSFNPRLRIIGENPTGGFKQAEKSTLQRLREVSIYLRDFLPTD